MQVLEPRLIRSASKIENNILQNNMVYMEVQLYQIRIDGYSEYLIFCPKCDYLFTIHETYMGNVTHDNKLCNICNHELQTNTHSAYLFCCSSTKVNAKDVYVPEKIKKLYDIYKEKDREYELNIYKNTIEYKDTELLK
jgi:hypothetical protein